MRGEDCGRPCLRWEVEWWTQTESAIRYRLFDSNALTCIKSGNTVRTRTHGSSFRISYQASAVRCFPYPCTFPQMTPSTLSPHAFPAFGLISLSAASVPASLACSLPSLSFPNFSRHHISDDYITHEKFHQRNRRLCAHDSFDPFIMPGASSHSLICPQPLHLRSRSHEAEATQSIIVATSMSPFLSLRSHSLIVLLAFPFTPILVLQSV
jgi:hypothetical protein